MSDHDHTHQEVQERPVDAGSQALSEALRSSFGILKIVMGLLVAVFVCSGIFTVGPQERAIKLRFGRAVGQGEKALLGPGLHWSWPYPFEEYVKVSVAGIKKVTSTAGWYATTPELELAGTEPYAGPTLNPAVDGYALTADNNILHTRATLTYHVADPVVYVFNFVDASNAVQSAVDSALLSAASQFKVDDILTRDVAGFKEAVRHRVVDTVKKQDLGIVVEECLVESRPPRQLKETFANVLKAEVMRNKGLNEARSYENQVLSKASADAQSRINAAESERVRLIADVSSRAEQFQELLPKYRDNPNLFVQQRLTEVLGRTLATVQDKIFLSEGADGKPKELRLLLNREPPKKAEETKP
ncbi:MAG TPA: protease modulator HflK [Candidatus Sulfotelmatobacter sp.]|nr:protease modulator HflK [Candidatus Sulfotelmatobacter sp.]